MREITNCQNCGAPIIYGKETCEYCGTPYNKIFTEYAKVDIDNEINKCVAELNKLQCEQRILERNTQLIAMIPGIFKEV